jgi:predicted acyltransferase
MRFFLGNYELWINILHSPIVAIPINKQLYSLSYVCFTGGAAGIILSAFYILVYVVSDKNYLGNEICSIPSSHYDLILSLSH